MLSASAATVLLAQAAGARAQSAAATMATAADTEWRHFGGDLANTRYSPLAQIDASNFGSLEVAWRVKTDKFGPIAEYRVESTPLLIKGRLFATAGTSRSVVSMDAETGQLLWVYHLEEGERALRAPRQKSGRGVSYWTDGKEERIFYVTVGYRLVALDAKTGQLIQSFGVNGIVDLKEQLDQDGIDLLRADIGLHATPTVANNVIIVGAAHTNGGTPATHHNVKGYARGFDAVTGARKWIFHNIPIKGEFGYDTWKNGTEQIGNGGVWAQISADEELGLAYLGVELGSGDYNGQYRAGNGLFGESIVAVDIQTGVRKWHYQLVHHGLWDNDIPCAAILCDIPVDGKIVKALAQPSKQGWLYVLNRETGVPIWPIVERKVPKGDVPGEWYSPTQPFPTKPPPYERQGVKIDDLIDFTPALRAQAVEAIKSYRIGPVYTPPTMSIPGGPYGTIIAPGIQGGTNWPGGSYDPETHKVYIYSKQGAGVLGMSRNTNTNVSDFEYVNAGAGQTPRQQGAMGAMPGSVSARPPGVADNAPDIPTAPLPADQRAPGLSIQGLPLVKPPYGSLTALDLNQGTIAWRIAHGATPDEIRNSLALKGLTIPRTGHQANIGPLTTKTLVIIGDGITTTNEKGVRGAALRAYDKATGAEVATLPMPAPQTGTPMTYMLKGRQYVLLGIGAGGYPAEFVALRLPRASAPAPAVGRRPNNEEG